MKYYHDRQQIVRGGEVIESLFCFPRQILLGILEVKFHQNSYSVKPFMQVLLSFQCMPSRNLCNVVFFTISMNSSISASVEQNFAKFSCIKWLIKLSRFNFDYSLNRRYIYATFFTINVNSSIPVSVGQEWTKFHISLLIKYVFFILILYLNATRFGVE